MGKSMIIFAIFSANNITSIHRGYPLWSPRSCGRVLALDLHRIGTCAQAFVLVNGLNGIRSSGALGLRNGAQKRNGIVHRLARFQLESSAGAAPRRARINRLPYLPRETRCPS
jgi:hypothetical protein